MLQFLRLNEATFAPFVGWRHHQDNLIFKENLGPHIPTESRTFDESNRYFACDQRLQYMLRIARGHVRPDLRVLLLKRS